MKELDTVILTADLPDHGLKKGDIGTVVDVHGGGAAYEVEFVTLDGETLAVATLKPSHLRSIAHREIAHARAIG
ncbi:MAG TPA: DUF4926 domain-containing protein [Phycisphaerae bacterium]|nr:DUF4926 domain-containing protein [Phycisphaerae bacterium]